MATAFRWKPAWDAIDDDDPHFAGMEVYDLSDHRDWPYRIYKGDQFWWTEERHLIEVTDVKTKTYRGVVGPEGEEGGDAVFYEPDWKPPRDPSTQKHWTDDINFLSVDDFVTMLDEGDLVPHRGNGLPPRPPY